jgi:DNA mismatch repair protein MutL
MDEVKNVIYKLPDQIANQIAAGEVVQRPASVVKELVENAVDAHATLIKVVIKDAGKSLIYVEDNGDGMSFEDAKMCFERHATSKLRTADDLFKIVTKGFRGEALASIAAIAQVELITKRAEDELATKVNIEGNETKEHAGCAGNKGTQFSIKHLFYNVPARRYFLKSDSIEWKHIVEEFVRVALVHPEIEMILEHNDEVEMHLPVGSLRQRIVKVMGAKFQDWLVPIEEETHWLKIKGFVVKPEGAKKSRGDQYFFVNNRFIKNSYLHHAVQTIFSPNIPDGYFAGYFIQLELDTSLIDVNIHPTKTEIKFQDERSVYAILHAATRRALGIHNVVPSLDFNQSGNYVTPVHSGTEIKVPSTGATGNYNPFGPTTAKRDVVQEWLQLQADMHQSIQSVQQANQQSLNDDLQSELDIRPLQMFKKWIVFEYNDEMWMVDQSRAHQQVLYESNMKKPMNMQSQALLNPWVMELGSKYQSIIKEIKPILTALGFVWEAGDDQLIFTAMPVLPGGQDAQQWLMDVVENWLDEYERVDSAQSLWTWKRVKQESIKNGQFLTLPEMKELVMELLECENPFFNPDHKKIIFKVNSQQLLKAFNL